MNRDILSKIEQEQMISREELEELLMTTDQELIEELYRRARATAGKYYGKEIYLRGLIEFTNYCKNDCYYCGIRRSNRNASRYRLTKEEILHVSAALLAVAVLRLCDLIGIMVPEIILGGDPDLCLDPVFVLHVHECHRNGSVFSDI